MSDRLREPYEALSQEIFKTLKGSKSGEFPLDYHTVWRGIHAMLRKFDISLRPVPLDMKDIDELPLTCPVCRKELGGHVATLQRFDETRQTYAHPECINYPK
jgi:hypothetical protein